MPLFNDFLSLIYPRRCEACDEQLMRHEHYLCNHCLVGLPVSNFHQQSGSELELLLAGRVPASRSMCFFLYEKSGRVQKLLHAIKYQGQKELGEYLGQLYAGDASVAQALDHVDVIVPIPLHKNKLKSRGYNQSEWFAKGLAGVTKRELNTSVLERVVETQTQTRKRKYERWENVEGIFRLNNPETLQGKHVLLVDDVITTGATIEAAWLALKAVSGIQVSVASIAFAGRGMYA